MSERNKALVHRLFDEVWNAGRVDRVEELYAHDFVADYRPYAPLRRGHDAIRGMVRRAWETYPDFHEELLQLIAEGDKVLVHLAISGTHLGPMGPIPPTGKKIRIEEMIVLTIADGKVVHQRGLVDNLHLLRQLGLVPSPPEFSDGEA
jgi:steroid delta-isomerase-like uncharacterized protein